MVESKTGERPPPQSILVVTCEVNEDHQGIRIDGANSITLTSFIGDLERIYNRENGLRSEIKVQGTTLDAIYSLLKGGVSVYSMLQAQFALFKRVEDLITAAKFGNEYLVRVGNLTDILVKRVLHWDSLVEQTFGSGKANGDGAGLDRVPERYVR